MNIFERTKLKKAKDLGSEAFKLGIKRMPCLDKELEDMVKKENQHEGRMNLYKRWLEGWDFGNINKDY